MSPLLLLPNEILREVLVHLFPTDLATLFTLRRVCKPLKSAVDRLLYAGQMPSKLVLSKFTPSLLIDSVKEQAEFSWPETLKRHAFIQRAMDKSKSKKLEFGVFDAKEESCLSPEPGPVLTQVQEINRTTIGSISLNGDSLFLYTGRNVLLWLGLNRNDHEILHIHNGFGDRNYTRTLEHPAKTFVHFKPEIEGFNRKHYRLNYDAYLGVFDGQLKIMDLTCEHLVATAVPNIELSAASCPVAMEYAGPGKCLLQLEFPDPEGEGGDIYHHYILEYSPENYSLDECSRNHCDCPNRKQFNINPETKKLQLVDLDDPDFKGKFTKSIVHTSSEPVILTANGEPLQPDPLPRKMGDSKAPKGNHNPTFFAGDYIICLHEGDFFGGPFAQMSITLDQENYKLYTMPGDIRATTLCFCYGQILFLGTSSHGILGYKLNGLKDLMNLDLENPDFAYDRCKERVTDIKVAYYKERLTIAFTTCTKVFYAIVDKYWLVS